MKEVSLPEYCHKFSPSHKLSSSVTMVEEGCSLGRSSPAKLDEFSEQILTFTMSMNVNACLHTVFLAVISLALRGTSWSTLQCSLLLAATVAAYCSLVLI